MCDSSRRSGFVISADFGGADTRQSQSRKDVRMSKVVSCVVAMSLAIILFNFANPSCERSI